MHVAVIGTGRVGRTTLMALIEERWIEKLTLIDTKPGLAKAIEEETRHALASVRNRIELESYEEDEKVEGADIVLITAGTPRTPDMDSRTDLTSSNASIIEEIGRAVVSQNPRAHYVVVTNPVDAMATLFKNITGANWVISTGTNLESQRFRAELAKNLDLPITSVSGFAGGEHGQEAVFLWSTVRIEGKKLPDYLDQTDKDLDKKKVERHVKRISRKIIKYSGGTRHGPGTSFRDILRSIATNDNKVLSVASPFSHGKIPEEVMVSLPRMVGRSLGPTFEPFLESGEMEKIKKAAERVYKTWIQQVSAT